MIRAALIALALLAAAPAWSADLTWTNPRWESYADTSIHVAEKLDTAFVYSSRWDCCSPEKLIATLVVQNREGMVERVTIARPPGVYSYRVRVSDLAGNRSWWSNEVSADERPAGIAMQVRLKFVRELWAEPR